MFVWQVCALKLVHPRLISHNQYLDDFRDQRDFNRRLLIFIVATKFTEVDIPHQIGIVYSVDPIYWQLLLVWTSSPGRSAVKYLGEHPVHGTSQKGSSANIARSPADLLCN